MKFGRFLGRGNSKDRAIIHQSVPEEVLYPEGRAESVGDMSWLDDLSEKPTAAEPASPQPAEEVVAEAAVAFGTQRDKRVPRPVSKPAAPIGQATAALAPKAEKAVPIATDKIADIAEFLPNGPAVSGRKHPVGWLVVVEGPGVGAWFALEQGTSHIGRKDGQTVQLDFGDDSVEPARHASVTYDKKQNTFLVDSATKFRLNGVAAQAKTTLRDGDVFTVGQTSLRLVALCTPNFNWG